MKKILLLLVALLATTTVWAADFITDVMVIGGSKSVVNSLKDSYTSEGWTVIDQDLNAGCGSGSDYIYLLYRTDSNESLDAGAFITGFYISNASGTAPDNVTYGGHTYTLVPYDGSDYFKNNKGDLNSHCGSGSAYIHLYYTKDNNENYSSTAVNSITFDATQSGAIGVTGDSEGYDLNTGCGSGSAYIYMHAGTGNKGWTISMNSAQTQCTITGYQGTKNNKSSITIPKYIDGASVTGFSGSVFSGFTNLETMVFYENTQVSQMPSMQGCSKFKNIKTGNANNKTPASMTSIPASAFVGTALENVTLTSVTNVGSNAFAGSTTLNSVVFNLSPVTIGDGAFSAIVREGGAMCQVTYPGSIDAWTPSKYMYSPSLVVNGGSGSNTWSCGWCGGGSSSSYNHLYWTLDAAGQLKIDCADNNWSNHPTNQEIVFQGWNNNLVKSLTLEHVYSLGVQEFINHTNLKNVYINPTLHSIGSNAFYGCNSLTDVWFDGTQAQWSAVDKASSWKPSATTEHWRCTVTFNANGHGTAPAAQTLWSNYDKATAPTAPTANGCTFLGWYTEAACTNQWDFNTVVPGDMTLYAKWELRYTFNSATGELALLKGEFNKYNKWGSDVPASAVKSVTATSQVSFTGDCSELFDNFNKCTSMELDSVNTSAAINMSMMFKNCNALYTLNISSWDTGNVTNMSFMFSNCMMNLSDTLDLSNWNTSNVTDMSYMFSTCRINIYPLDISGWDTGNVTNMSNMFANFYNSYYPLNLSGWNTSKVNTMDFMFQYCSNLTSLNLSGWDISNVGNMFGMFVCCYQLTTIYVTTSWNAENVGTSSNMFMNCEKLVGGMGTTFDSNYTDKTYGRIDHGTTEPGYLTGAFTLTLPVDVTASPNPVFTIGDTAYYTAGTTVTLTYNGEVPEGKVVVFAVNGTAIEGNTFEMPLDNVTITATVTDPPQYTFNSETGELALLWGEFNKDNKWGDDVTNTAVKSVTATSEVSFTGDCTNLFLNFSNCESMDLSNVNTSNVTNMSRMFQNCTVLDSLDLSGWNTENVNSMLFMFNGCKGLTSLDISGWNTGNVTNMRYMFIECEGLTSLVLSGWNTENVTDMYCMFYGCKGLTSLDLSGFNTENVTNMRYMFDCCSGLTSLDLSGWNTGKVTDMYGMFHECSGLTSLDISGWNTGNVRNMSQMFYGCQNMTSFDLSGWNTGNVRNMNAMFRNCSGLTSLDISEWNTEKVTDMYGMFYNCSGLTSLDLSGWNTEKVTDMTCMFYSCTDLTTIYAGNGWNTENVEASGYNMFYGCQSLVGGMGTTYDENHIDAEYARIDGGPESPGYFTAAPQGVPGDVDGDGNVTAGDITALYNWILNGDGDLIVNGDQDGDGFITSSDVTFIYNILLGNSK